jgi:hypothetical protein
MEHREQVQIKLLAGVSGLPLKRVANLHQFFGVEEYIYFYSAAGSYLKKTHPLC